MVLRKRPKPPKPDKPTGPSGPTAPTAATGPTGPTGPAPTMELGSYGNASIDQWDQAFIRASDAVLQKRGVRVDPRFVKAMMEIESGGDGFYPASRCRPSDGTDNVPACGPMQIKHAYHKHRCPECDFTTVPGQIELATHIIGMPMKEYGWDEYRSFLSVYFPTDDINGTTQQAYVQRLRSLVSALKKDAGGITPAPAPRDVLDALFGGKPYTVSAGYGQLVTWSCPGCYDYFAQYGLPSTHHWAYDAAANAGDGAPLYAPFDGTVVCAGTNTGAGAWGTGCAAFPHRNNYGGKPGGIGAGRLELLHADGDRSLILGHVLRSTVAAGNRVKAGDVVGQQGGMNGSHVHVEARYDRGRRIGDPRVLFGGGATTPAVRPIPYVWNSPNRNEFRVTVDHDTAVHQRADPASPKLYALAKSKQVDAVAVVPGNDGAEWWLLTDDGRLPRTRTSFTVKVS